MPAPPLATGAPDFLSFLIRSSLRRPARLQDAAASYAAGDAPFASTRIRRAVRKRHDVASSMHPLPRRRTRVWQHRRPRWIVGVRMRRRNARLLSSSTNMKPGNLATWARRKQGLTLKAWRE